MVMGIADLCLAQEDGCVPITLAAGSAPGESGVSLHFVRFQGGLHLSGTLRHHLICFQLAQARFDCRMGGRTLRYDPPPGSLAICPAGIDCAADAKGGLDAILIAIDPCHFALAAAENSALEAQLMERLQGLDTMLFDLARCLGSQSAAGYPDGPLFWNEAANSLIDGLVARHTSKFQSHARGTLGRPVLERHGAVRRKRVKHASHLFSSLER
jgi:AraC family transcriptional regulator